MATFRTVTVFARSRERARVCRYAKPGVEAMALLTVFMDKVGDKLDKLTVHRFLGAGMLVAAKLTHEKYINNVHYAKIAGLAVDDLNLLERELLGCLVSERKFPPDCPEAASDNRKEETRRGSASRQTAVRVAKWWGLTAWIREIRVVAAVCGETNGSAGRGRRTQEPRAASLLAPADAALGTFPKLAPKIRHPVRFAQCLVSCLDC